MSDSVTKWYEMQEEKKTSKQTSKKIENMSKMSEIDQIAQGVADHCKEIMYDSVEWQIADQPVEGDDYNALHSMVMDKAIHYMYTNTIRKTSDNINVTNK